jgi:hypothetical protein
LVRPVVVVELRPAAAGIIVCAQHAGLTATISETIGAAFGAAPRPEKFPSGGILGSASDDEVIFQ